MKIGKCPNCGCEFSAHPEPKTTIVDRVVSVVVNMLFWTAAAGTVGLVVLLGLLRACASSYCGG